MLNRRQIISILPFAGLFGGSAVVATPCQATQEHKDLPWGTYGKNHEYKKAKWITLGECETDHLKAILRTQHQIPPHYVVAICAILRDRGVTDEPWDMVGSKSITYYYDHQFRDRSTKLHTDGNGTPPMYGRTGP